MRSQYTEISYITSNHKVILKHNVIYNDIRNYKTPEINLTKETHNLYTEYYKTLKRKIKEGLNKQLCSWIIKLNISMSVLPKLIYRFNTVSMKIAAGHVCVHVPVCASVCVYKPASCF